MDKGKIDIAKKILDAFPWLFSGIGVIVFISVWEKIKKSSIFLYSLCSSKLGFHKNYRGKNRDTIILNDFSEIFSGDTVYNFFEWLVNSRTIFIEQCDRFENGIKRFLAADKHFSNRLLEKRKNDFLYSLDAFLTFSNVKFNPINERSCKFYGGISELRLLRDLDLRNQYDEDEKKYLELINDLHTKWGKFQNSVNCVMPDYHWRD